MPLDRPEKNGAGRPQAAPAGVVAALRAATAGRHAVVDRTTPLAVPAPGLPHYRSHLLLLQAWLTPLQEWLADFRDGPQACAALPEPDRLAALAQDLADLDARGIAAAPGLIRPGVMDAPLLPRNADAAWRWGICYVIEGSQLGGAVLSKDLAQRYPGCPLRYLSGNGRLPGPRWHAFMNAIGEQVREQEDIEAACRGACAAFDRLLALMPPPAKCPS